MYPLKQSTAITIPFFAHDIDGDAVTGLVNGDFVKRISKNGGAFGAMTVTITELENGWYSLPVGSGHSDTNGILSMTFTSATIKQVNLQFRVSATGFDDIPTAAENVNEWETQSQADPTGFHVNAMEWLSQAIATPTNNGVPEIDLTHIMGTILTEGGAGRLAASLIKFLDVAVPTGTINSLPAAIPDAAGGLPVSDAGGLDLDTKLANTNEITVARMGALTDWIDGGRLDLILDLAATEAKLLAYVQLMARKDAAIATDKSVELGEINADEGSGAGAYVSTTDSLQNNFDTLQATSIVSGSILGDTNEIQQKLPANYIMGSSVTTDKDDEIDAAATEAKLLAYVQLMTRKDAAIATDNAAEVTEINADGGSGAGAFDSETDSEQAIRDAIVDANPQNHAATANNETTGTLDSGTFADTATDNGVYWQTSPVTPAVGGFGLNVDLTFGIGVGRVPSAVIVNGRFGAGAQRTVQVWAYDYNLAAYVQLSNSATDFGNSVSDSTQQYALTTDMVQTSDGEVSIRFTSTSITVGDDWYCDYVNVSSVAQEAAGLTAQAISQAVWEHLTAGHDEGTMGHVLENSTVIQADVVSVTDATQFIIDDGVAVNDAYNGMIAMVEDATDGHYEARRIVNWIGATKEIFLDRALSFTPDSSDHCHIIGPAYADVNVTHSAGTAQTANDNGADIDLIKTAVDSILVDTALMDKWLNNRIAFSGTSMILYDDDAVTPLLTWTISEGSLTVSGPYNRAAGV